VVGLGEAQVLTVVDQEEAATVVAVVDMEEVATGVEEEEEEGEGIRRPKVSAFDFLTGLFAQSLICYLAPQHIDFVAPID